MTVKAGSVAGDGVSCARGYFIQTLIVMLINVPTVSFGLALGWVSGASAGVGAGEGEGEGAGEGAGAGGGALVAAAVSTFLASLLGVPLSARALAAGRKVALIASSLAFVACWSLKLCGGGWWVVCARACAGLGGAGAWCVAPLLAREMCSSRVRGAAVSATVVAHNLGLLLMYLAALTPLAHSTVLWSCLTLSAVHCAVCVFMPESPYYLAAHGRHQEAAAALAWARGTSPDSEQLRAELATLPAHNEERPSAYALVRDMLSVPGRRRALVVCLVCVAGQEACGVLALLQYAQHVFVLAAREAGPAGAGGASPAALAAALGGAQLAGSLLALYLVERVGRRRLAVGGACATGALLALGGAAPRWAGGALAGAVLADSAGLQPAPYAALGDMFAYEYRGCALTLVSAGAWAGNALEAALFPALARAGGLRAALGAGGALTLALALFAARALPETRGKSPEQIYRELCPDGAGASESASDRTVCTKL